ncbi:hypothetical protein [Holzapfeliella sp. JNUCC 80]
MSKRISLVSYLENKIKQFEKDKQEKSPGLVFLIRHFRRATLFYLGLLIIDFFYAMAIQNQQQVINTIMGFHIEIISRSAFKYHTLWTTKLLLTYGIVIVVWFTIALVIRLSRHNQSKK